LERKYSRTPATVQNFDEAAYLRANPDVAAAVSAGEFGSGRDHFEHHGQAEGRYQATADDVPFTSYEARPPSPSNAFDLFAGRWTSQIPGYGYGSVPIFSDPRLAWFLEELGDVKGHRILELGPLEGGHTYMLSQAGADVTAIEANTGAYLRCLIVKEALGFKAKFLLGDLVSYVSDTTERFDAIVASGVLYHMERPVEVLGNLARISNVIMLWTHYFDDEPLRAANLRHKFAKTPAVQMRGDVSIELWEQRYLDAVQWAGFCGGPEKISNWLTRRGLFDILQQDGFHITVHVDERDHPNGPAIGLLAQRVPAR
jgi:hypothetical protein